MSKVQRPWQGGQCVTGSKEDSDRGWESQGCCPPRQKLCWNSFLRWETVRVFWTGNDRSDSCRNGLNLVLWWEKALGDQGGNIRGGRKWSDLGCMWKAKKQDLVAGWTWDGRKAVKCASGLCAGICDVTTCWDGKELRAGADLEEKSRIWF